MQIDFKFELTQDVNVGIKKDIKGEITGLCYRSGDRKTYEVTRWNNGNRKSDWMEEWEIEHA